MKIKVTPKKNAPETKGAARFAEQLLNGPERRAKTEAEASKEFVRQVLRGESPSEGMPDVRRSFRTQEEG